MTSEKRTQYEAGGFRERYAMEHGNQTTVFINGAKCYKCTYSPMREYQDANGAIYNTVTKKWIN